MDDRKPVKPHWAAAIQWAHTLLCFVSVSAVGKQNTILKNQTSLPLNATKKVHTVLRTEQRETGHADVSTSQFPPQPSTGLHLVDRMQQRTHSARVSLGPKLHENNTLSIYTLNVKLILKQKIVGSKVQVVGN